MHNNSQLFRKRGKVLSFQVFFFEVGDEMSGTLPHPIVEYLAGAPCLGSLIGVNQAAGHGAPVHYSTLEDVALSDKKEG